MITDCCLFLPKATCERGFAAMEDTHQKVVHDLQRQHQREISQLMEERERLLAEETAATIAGEDNRIGIRYVCALKQEPGAL